MGGLVERIVPRNQTIPTAMAQDFTTYKDGQTALALHVVQASAIWWPTAAAWPVLSCVAFRRWPLARRASGSPSPWMRWSAERRCQGTNQRRGGQDRRETVLWPGDEQIAKMLQDSFLTAEQDMRARALAEARVDADRMVLATQSAIAADGDLLSDEERARMDALMAAVVLARPLEDAVAIEAATDALAKGTEAFAAMRMNRGIQQALAGKNIETV